MDSNYIILAVPFFIFLIALELVLSHRRGLRTYRLHDSIANLACGVGSQIYGLGIGALGFFLYAKIWQHFRLFEISPNSVLAWVVLFLIDDFCYYLYHWASHRVNFLWATHAVHHQSEEYNLAVALRQSWFTGLTSFVFYLPLAVLGFPMMMYLLVRTANTLYQFWIHSRPIGKLGPLEWVLNTPSHHRVHHGINPVYIDRNHAGVLIIWDRLLGTFIEEQAEPVYGVVKPLASYNPVWANFVELRRLAKISQNTRRWADKIKIWFMPPEWHPADHGGTAIVPEITRETQIKYDPRPTPWVSAYVVASFALCFFGGVLFLMVQTKLPVWQQALYIGEMTLAMVAISGLTERKSWAPPLEVGRLLSLVGVALLLPKSYALGLVGLALTLLGAVAAAVVADRAAANNLVRTAGE
jgi:sterol desaturase/sphingolipid hydroxylase (fatty acid hydroxylase superfamily)